MTLHPGSGAQALLRLWLTLWGGTIALLCLSLALWWNLRLLGLAALSTSATVLAVLWYPARYFRRWQATCTTEALTAVRGVLWQQQWHIPLPALCTATWWETPVSRRLGCGLLVLHHSGGITWLPFLSTEEAAALLCRWEDTVC